MSLDQPARRKREQRFPSLSPSPPPMAIPSFLAAAKSRTTGSGGIGEATPQEEQENERREKFKNVYMEKLVEGFGADLQKMRSVSDRMKPDWAGY